MKYYTDGIDELIYAVIEQASKDYVNLKKDLIRLERKGKRNVAKEVELNIIRKWFLSEKFKVFNLARSGEYYVERMDKYAAEQVDKHKRRKDGAFY